MSELQNEIDHILEGLEALTSSDIFQLADGEDPEDPEIYRQAHYRGRTFDRTRIQEAEPEQPPQTPGARFGGILRTIQEEAREAHDSGSQLCQEPRTYHRPLGPTGFQPD